MTHSEQYQPRLVEVTNKPRVIRAIKDGIVAGGAMKFGYVHSEDVVEYIFRWFGVEASVEEFLKTDVNPPEGGVRT